MRFTDIYIRPAGQPFTDITLFAVEGNLGNLLDTWERLTFIKRAPNFEIGPDVTEDYNDGTTGVASEKISLEFATFRTDKVHYDYLRTLHNTKVDLLWFDTADDSFISVAFGLALSVYPVAVTNESAIIKLTAARTFSVNTPQDTIFLLGQLSPYGVISGYVYRPGGITPDAGVVVSVTGTPGTFADVTDANGFYQIYVDAHPAGTTYTFTLTRSGATYPTGQTISAKQETEVSKNFTALT